MRSFHTGERCRNIYLHWLPISTRIEYKVLLLVLTAHMGMAPKYLRDAIRPLPHPFVLYARWKGGSSLFLGPGQPWPCLDLFPLLALLFGIAFHLQLVLLSYHPIFLRPYDFLKLFFFFFFLKKNHFLFFFLFFFF